MLLAHAAVTPAGNPVAVPIPVAPVVVCVIVVITVLIQGVGDEEAVVVVLIGHPTKYIESGPLATEPMPVVGQLPGRAA